MPRLAAFHGVVIYMYIRDHGLAHSHARAGDERVDPDARTVVWPNGLDLAPEVLHGDFDAVDELGFQDITSTRQPA